MALADPSRTWEEASSPDAVRLARRFETAWRAAPSSRPDPVGFLPEGPGPRAGVLLALLRADLALRHEAGEPARVERYCLHPTGLADDVLVALLYEEFCLREEAGEAPDPSEYEARFPAVAAQFREVLDIHDLVASSGSLSRASNGEGPGPATARFPEAGQTIAGFRLVEELGRGAFARVFLAEERRLGDRAVALKIARAGTREPQTLARLQHTHIVPVYSYRADPATGLHLLCMPYFGRVTLAAVLADPGYRAARTGADLLAVLDGLRPPGDVPSPRAEGRAALAGRPFARALAWWGARLAEALDHAHGRGVLHRDVKPSNVLLTADATPMLLDFNLAQPDPAAGPATRTAALGGTLAYMAPEHLAAVGGGTDEAVDGRADVFALGVVLFEALAGRPFAAAPAGRPALEALRAMVAERRAGPPRLDAGRRAVPAALVAVVRRCLAPEPADRYAAAAELAVDLQAVADDGPLVYAREPQPARALRWASRHRRRIAVALPVALALVAGTAAVFHAQADRLRREAMVLQALSDGRHRAQEGQHAVAESEFKRAEELAAGTASLRALADEARRRRAEAQDARLACATADAFFAGAEPLRFRLIEGQELKATSRALEQALAPLHVLDPAPWTRRPEVAGLDATRRARLVEEVNELLFLWVVASDRPGDPARARRARAVCERALTFAEPAGPWRALRSRYDPGRQGPEAPPDPSREPSARACFQWAVLAARLDRQPARALAWLERAVRLRPDRFWYQFALAFHYALFDDVDRALAHYDAALALRPDSAWALFNRAQLYWSRKGAWDRARDDLERVRAAPGGLDPSALRLEFGQIAQRLGDFPRALAEYEAAVAPDPEGKAARKARLNRAKLAADLGALDCARAGYESLLAGDPKDVEARTGRALLALRLGDVAGAEAGLTRLLDEAHGPDRRGDWLAARALARLALGRPCDAGPDAEEAERLRPSPSRSRLLVRVALAAGRNVAAGALVPDDVDRLPARGPRLSADLQAAAGRLREAANGPDAAVALPARLTRAVLLSALGRHAEARGEADRAVAIGPTSARALGTRALVRRRAGDRAGALADVDAGLILDDDPRLRELRGRLLLEAGRPREALVELDRAATGAGVTAHATKARALGRLGRVGEAVAEWTLALRDDPEDGTAFLGRACCFLRLGAWDHALADLEGAADRSGDDPSELTRVTAAYAACLAGRPDRIPRVRSLLRRTALAWLREVGAVAL